MDWKTFITQNAGALIGSISAIIGVIIGAVISFVLQYQQRSWMLDDQWRQWKRQRLTEHISPIQNWVNEALRMLRTFELLSNEKFVQSAFAKDFSSELQEQYKTYLSTDATLYPHLTALNDNEIIKYWGMFREAYFLFIEAATKKDENKILDIQKALVMASTLINRRIDDLYNETFVTRKRRK